MPTILKFLGIAGTVLGAVFAFVKVIFNSWHDSQQKIRQLETDQLTGEFTTLKEQLGDTKKSNAVVWKELKTTQVELQKTREQFIRFESRVEAVIDSEKSLVIDLDKMRKANDLRFKDIDDTFADAQLIKIGVNNIMIKKRRNLP